MTVPEIPAILDRLVQRALDSKRLPVEAHGLYFVLTAADVLVERFCMSSCGSHGLLTSNANKLPYAWVGNAETQCLGMCAWPFAPLPFPGAPTTAPARSPNGDIGMDGMVINFAAMLAGASTNPGVNAYYQGDALAPLEAATACSGSSPADLFTDKKTVGNLTVFSTAGFSELNFVGPFPRGQCIIEAYR